ncbi:MAG: hypothetical protein RJQ09_20415 [Cyclobacteriaceae bacterium]
MTIEKTDNEILIRLPSTTNIAEIERLVKYLEFREITSRSKATQDEIDQLARESKASWWEQNRQRFIK